MAIPCRPKALTANQCRFAVLWGINPRFHGLFPCRGQVPYALRTRAPVAIFQQAGNAAPRLACVRPAASVHPEPGSNSSLSILIYLIADNRKALPAPSLDSIPVRDAAVMRRPLSGTGLPAPFCCLYNIPMNFCFGTKKGPRAQKIKGNHHITVSFIMLPQSQSGCKYKRVFLK